ncbi:hypothetical protein [Alkalilimnicola ehrlichii]|uniref:hypothetical protein n=1 Tax=Alkalilimnicola ehrlichii TaxID=351052 RepID=UPI0021638BF9|nr:hypothetical protein [Alkalilimnicola ehrlichii]
MAEEGDVSVSAGESTVIKLGVSSCLLGEAVRFDAGHKRDRFVADVLPGFLS